MIKTVQGIKVNSLDRLPTLNRQNLKPFHRTYLYGWGLTEDGTYAEVLRHTKLIMRSTISSLVKKHDELLYSFQQNATGQVGDSGSPWMSLDNSRIYGIHVGQNNPFGVAVKIAFYANWIFYVMYEYRDLIPATLPSNRVIRVAQNINEAVYQTRLKDWS